MHVVLAWFSARPLTPETRGAFRDRFETSIRGLVPASYVRYEIGGDDWGVIMLHPGQIPSTRWEAVQSDDRITAVSLGIPIGAPRGDTGIAMARRLLAGESVHRGLVPPFALMAVDQDGEFAVQQDWLGMCRLFAAESGGVTALCTRPSMLGHFLHGTVEPDLDGWTSYAVCGHFGGDMSPIRGVRLLSPGERMTGRRGSDGGWTIKSRIGHAVDDVVLAGLEAQGRPLDATLASAADEFATTAAAIHDQYDDIVLGLSGGRDSRLIAASLVAAGRVPRLNTNDDIAAEGEIASELVRILREKRGLEVVHNVRPAASPSVVLGAGLRDRVLRLQRFYDYQFAYSYIVRPPKPELLPARPVRANITGAGGELATGFWYGKPGSEADPEQTAMAHLMPSLSGVSAAAVERERDRVGELLRRAKDKGVRGPHLIDYLYLVERVRRWSSAAYSLNIVTPFLSPSLVSAMFALTPEQKRDRVLHTGLTQRLVPEWADVPFFTGRNNTGTVSTVPKIWDGDGAEVIADLIDTAGGPIAELVDTEVVEQMLVKPNRAAPRGLQRFTYLALASHQLEPHAVRPSTGATHRRVLARTAARDESAASNPVLSRLQWIKRTSPGRAVWAAVRTHIRRR
ncbi:hypothetical protein AB0M20_05430 [Actinoplanes sp. NPDC051633]|uniref:hypothetical protein n=1 Tax=Actinoplanes sp. NPDC051633 TaxID=3155670 RepID=UPI003438A19F